MGGVAAKVIGGWQCGGIRTFADGTPICAGAIGDSAALNNNSGPNRANATGISPIPDNRTASNFWNIKSLDPFDPSLTYKIGNLGKGSFLKPGTRQSELAMNKNFRLSEGHSLQFRCDGFNS